MEIEVQDLYGYFLYNGKLHLRLGWVDSKGMDEWALNAFRLEADGAHFTQLTQADLLQTWPIKDLNEVRYKG